MREPDDGIEGRLEKIYIEPEGSRKAGNENILAVDLSSRPVE